MRDPLGYHAANVGDLINLLAAVTSTATRLFLFSSSAAVYGNPAHVPVDEDAPTRPESPYGQTKLIGEWLVRDVARAYGLSWGALRYFNVVGAASAQLADTGEGNLVPLVLRAVKDGRRPRVFGLDYPTRDGSCIRDFIAVEDVARAHVLAARALRIGREVGVLNLGRGEGASVLEVLAQIGAASGRSVDYEAAERRAGDPAEVVANPQRAHRVLRWRAEHDLAGMIDSAWQAFKQQHGERRREGGQ